MYFTGRPPVLPKSLLARTKDGQRLPLHALSEVSTKAVLFMATSESRTRRTGLLPDAGGRHSDEVILIKPNNVAFQPIELTCDGTTQNR